MKKLHVIFGICLSLILAGVLYSSPDVEAKPLNEDEQNGQEIQLTDQQKAELDVLYKDIMETRKQIINKYVEYGVISEEKAEKKIAHINEFYEKLKSNNYIPKWNHKHRHHHDHES